jgi:hypothetical protein
LNLGLAISTHLGETFVTATTVMTNQLTCQTRGAAEAWFLFWSTDSVRVRLYIWIVRMRCDSVFSWDKFNILRHKFVTKTPEQDFFKVEYWIFVKNDCN